MDISTITEFRLKLHPRDFAKARVFYEQTLGFSAANEWDRGENDKGVMFRVGPAVLELLSPEGNYEPIMGADISLEVSDVQALWESLKDRTDMVFALRDNDWGDTSFCVRDPEGFKITFFTRVS